MNQDQFLGPLKVVVPAILAWVVGKGYIPAGAASDIGAAVLAAAAAMWSYYNHSDKSKIAAVAAMPDISKIVVSLNAPKSSAAATAAADASQPKVTSAISDTIQPKK